MPFLFGSRRTLLNKMLIKSGIVPPDPSRLAAHALLADFGDGLLHKGTCKGLANPINRAMMSTKAIFREIPGGDQSISGDNMDANQTVRQGYTDALNPDVLISSMGHNPPYGLDKSSSESEAEFVARFMARWGTDLVANRFAAKPSLRYIIATTPPSTASAELNRNAIWAAQETFIDSLIASGKKAYKIAWQNGIDTSTMMRDGTHWDEDGGDYTGPILGAALDQIGTILPFDVVLDQVTAIPEAGLGANLETNHNLVASAGYSATIAFSAAPINGDTLTINGATCTFVTSGATGANQCNIGTAAATATNLRTVLNSNLATYGITSATSVQGVASVRIDSSSASDITLSRSSSQPLFTKGKMAVGWAVSNLCPGINTLMCDVISGEQIFTVTGIPTAEAPITWSRLTNLAHSDPYGAHYEWLFGLRIDNGSGGNTDGVKTFGAGQGGTNQGVWMNGGAADAAVGDWNGQCDTLARTVPKTVPATSVNYAGAFNVRLSPTVSNSSRSIVIKVRKPIDRRVNTKAWGRPIYLGDDWVQGGATSNPHVPTAQAGQMGPIAVPVNGGTITARTGEVSCGNITFSPAWYKNVPIDLAEGSLPEEHPTTPVSPFSTAFSSGVFSGLVSGDKIRFYSRPTNDFFGSGTRPILQPYIEYTVA